MVMHLHYCVKIIELVKFAKVFLKKRLERDMSLGGRGLGVEELRGESGRV